MPVLAGTVYATTTDLGNLGLIGGVLASVPAGAQTAALQAASAIADSYLQGQYILPITQWGYDLTRVVCVLAAWDILTAKGYNPAAGPDQNIRQRYEDALKWLDEVSKGIQSPINVIDSSTAPSASDGSDVSVIDGGSLVTTDVRGWTDRGSGTPPASTDPWGF